MDKISRLPDEVICHILSFLPTKHAVATSVLSSRWVNLWSYVPAIDLDDRVFINQSKKYSNSELFIRFTERFLSLNQSQTIAKFRLCMHDCCEQTLSGINGIIHNVISRHVVEIDLGIFSEIPVYGDRLTIPDSESLKVLKVRTEYCLKLPAFPGCFPSLHVVDLDVSVDEGDEWITNLFPCLPALEKLSLVGDLDECTGEINFNIGGAALKHLELDLMNYNYDECDPVVVIDAPKLDYLKLKDEFLGSYLVKDKPEISEVRLDVGDYHEVGHTRLARFNELLHSFGNTKCLSVSASTLKVVFSQRCNIPVLPSLTKLELELPASSWVLLVHWLESCPNLRVLSLTIKEESIEEFEEEFDEEFEEVVLDVVPSCLSSCIKEIEIKRLGKFDHEKMLKYLLDNAKILDKFVVDSRVCTKDGIGGIWKV